MKEVEVTLDVKTKKKYELDLLPSHQNIELLSDNFFQKCLVWEISNFGENLKSGKKVKKVKVVKPRIL